MPSPEVTLPVEVTQVDCGPVTVLYSGTEFGNVDTQEEFADQLATDEDMRAVVLSAEEELVLSRVRPPYRTSLHNEKDDGADTTIVQEYILRAAQNGLLTAEEEILLGRLVQKGLAAKARLEVSTSQSENCATTDRVLLEAGQRAMEVMRGCNLLLVVGPARKWHRQYRNIGVMDFIQEGASDGLTRAIEKFDPERGFKFSTYAMQWIDNAMQRCGQKQDKVIKMPIRLYTSGKLKKYEDMKKQGISEEDIARKLGPTPEEHQQLKDAYAAQQLLHLDAEIQGHSGDPMPLHSVVADRQALELVEKIGTEQHRVKPQVGPVYEALLTVFEPQMVWAFMKRNEGIVLNDTDNARAHRMTQMVQHPAVQSMLRRTLGEVGEWDDAACAEAPKNVLKSKEKRIKEMCMMCPLLDKCEELVAEIHPTQGQWAGLTRSKKSYYPNGSPATVRGVAVKPQTS